MSQDANAYLDKVLTEAASSVGSDNAPDIPAALHKGVAGAFCIFQRVASAYTCNSDTFAGQQELRTPWFEAYKKELLRTLAFANHETYDYPVACKQASLHNGTASAHFHTTS